MAQEERRGVAGRGIAAGGESAAGLLDSADSRRFGLALMEDSVVQTLGASNSKERWNSYAEVPARLSVLIPLPPISLNQLLALEPGTMLVTEWQTTQDMPLIVGDVFLANVSCEPSGERLGVRINGFDQPMSGL